MRNALYMGSQLISRKVSGKFRTVAIQSTPVSNFQVRIVLTPSNFDYTGVMANGNDIRFYGDSYRTQQLPIWWESWNYQGTSAVWVNVTTAGTTTLYMNYVGPTSNYVSISNIDSVMDNGVQFGYFADTIAAGGVGAFNSFQFGGFDSVMSTDWGSGTVQINGQGSLADYVSIRWRGWVKPYGSGTHTFYLTTDDGSRMFIGPDSTVNSSPSWTINTWQDQGPTEYSANVSIADGVPRYLQKEWFETGGGATALTGWATPNVSKVYPITSGYLKGPKYSSGYPDSFGSNGTVSAEISA